MATWSTTVQTVEWSAVDDPSVVWQIQVNPTVAGGGGAVTAFQYVGHVTPGTLGEAADFVTGGTFSVVLPFTLQTGHEIVLTGTSNDADGAYVSTGTDESDVTTLVLADVQPLQMQYRTRTVGFNTDTTTVSRGPSTYMIVGLNSTDTALFPVSGSAVTRVFMVGVRISGALTIQDLIDTYTWAAITISGYYLDNTGLYYVDAEYDTMTPAEFRHGDVAQIITELNTSTFVSTSSGRWYYVQSDLTLSALPIPTDTSAVNTAIAAYLAANPPTTTRRVIRLEETQTGYSTPNLGNITGTSDVVANLRPVGGTPGQFSEFNTCQHDWEEVETGVWDDFEDGVFWGDGVTLDVYGDATIAGKPYYFFENTIIGGSEEQPLRIYVDVGYDPRVMTRTLRRVHFASNTFSVYVETPYSGDLTAHGREWKLIYTVTDAGFASFENNGGPWIVGWNFAGDIDTVESYDGATRLYAFRAEDATPSVLSWVDPEGNTFTAAFELGQVVDESLADVAARAESTLSYDLNSVPTSRVVDAGTGLSISPGGDLSQDQTLSVTFGTTEGTVAEGNDVRLPPTPVGATDGHVLTVDNDTFVLAAPSGGGWTVISDITVGVGGASAIDVALPTCRAVRISWGNVQSTRNSNSDTFALQFAVGGGAIDTGSNYSMAGGALTTAGFVALIAGSQTNTDRSASGQVFIGVGVGRWTTFSGVNALVGSTTSVSATYSPHHGAYKGTDAAALSALRLYAANGDITEGSWVIVEVLV